MSNNDDHSSDDDDEAGRTSQKRRISRSRSPSPGGSQRSSSSHRNKRGKNNKGKSFDRAERSTNKENETNFPVSGDTQAVEAENERLRDQIFQLKAKQNAPLIQFVSKKRKKQDGEEEKLWIGRIQRAVKVAVFPRCKFLGPTKLPKATQVVFEHLNLKKFTNLDEQTMLVARDKWMGENADHVRQGMNEARNYSQSQVREETVKRLVAGKSVPTAAQVLDCATRKKDLMKGAENKLLFDYYVDVLLVKVAGTDLWNRKYRHFCRLSTAVHSDTNQPCITPGTEAFLVLLFEGCEEKWKYLAECKKEKKKHDRKNERCRCLFTNPEAGQCPFGGWSKAGMKRFKELQELIKTSRQAAHVRDMENECIIRLADKHQQAHPSTKKAAKGPEEPVYDSDGAADFGF